MEKLSDLKCIPTNMGWSDVGSWDEISRLSEEVPSLRVDSHAKVFNINSQQNYIYSLTDKVFGLVDVKNLIVVDTEDALLISKKGSSQKVTDLLKKIKESGLSQATEHKFEIKPWGKFEILKDENSYKAKVITVNPGEQLSYQSHQKRQENWIIVKGQAVVILENKEHNLSAGDSIIIPTGAKHRICNKTKSIVKFVEVQTGSYFGEDDIVRYQDDYNRD